MAVNKATLGPTGRTARRTPNLTEPVAYTGTVAPTGALVNGKRKYTEKDFRDAYDAAHRVAGPNGKARVWMKPGWLEGFSASSGAPAAMSDVGVAGRASRILFYPEGGALGSVSLYGKSAKFVNFRGITIGGIQGGDTDDLGFLYVGGGDVGLWRSTVGFFNAYGQTGTTTDDISFVEVVVPTARIYESDSSAFRSASTTPGPITHGLIEGCWIAPTYRPTGTDSHTDTIQFSGSSEYDYFDIIDTVAIASTNHNLIIGSAGHVSLDNVALISHTRGKLFYVPTGVALPPSDYAGNSVGLVDSPIAINGGGQPGQFKMNNVDIIGEIKNAGRAMKGSVITNTRCSDKVSVDALKKTYGVTAVVLDEALGAITVPQMVAAYGAKPTKASLHALWSGTTGPVNPEDPEEPEEPGQPVDTTPPTVEFVTSNASAIAGTAVIVAKVGDTAPGTVVSTSFSAIAGGKTVQLGSGTSGANGERVLTFSTAGLATTGPVQFPVTCSVTDSGGNRASASRTYTVDNSGATPPTTNQPPVVTFLAPAAGSTLPRQGQTLLRARATDDRLVGTVGWELRNADGTITQVDGTGSLTTSSVYELALEMPTVPPETNGIRAYATEAGDSPLTTRTDWVPVSIAAAIDTNPPSKPVISAASPQPGVIVGTVTTPSTKGSQKILYEWSLDGVPDAANRSTERTRRWVELPLPDYDVQVTAYDEDGNSVASAEVNVVVHEGDKEKPTTPSLSLSDLKATSVVLKGTGSTDDVAIREYILRRGSDIARRSPRIEDFAAVALQLVEKTNYQYSFVAVDTAGNESEAAVISFRTPAIKAVLPSNWFEIDTLVRDAVSLANGEVEVAYSHEIVTDDGVSILTAPQVFRISDGRLLDDKGQPVKFYRSPDLRHWIEWRPRLLLDGRKVAAPPRKFTIPQSASDGLVHFYDLAFEVVAAPAAGVTSWGFGPPTSLYTSYYDISGPKPVLYLYGSPA